LPQIEEHHIQRALCLWLDGNPDANGIPRVTPALRPGVVYWHTPNSGEGRSAHQGRVLKQQGVKAGIPDLLFLWGGLFGIELKKPNGKPAETQLHTSQKQMHPLLRAAGIAGLATVDSLEAAKAQIRAWSLAQL
jgi:hypothetical protein